MLAAEPDPTEETTPPVSTEHTEDTEQQHAEDSEQQRRAEDQRAEDQALRNYIALAPYAAPRPGTAAAAAVARVAAAHQATTAARAHARAAKIGAISATRAQREIAALWAPRSSTAQHTDRQASRRHGDGR